MSSPGLDGQPADRALDKFPIGWRPPTTPRLPKPPIGWWPREMREQAARAGMQ